MKKISLLTYDVTILLLQVTIGCIFSQVGFKIIPTRHGFLTSCQFHQCFTRAFFVHVPKIIKPKLN